MEGRRALCLAATLTVLLSGHAFAQRPAIRPAPPGEDRPWIAPETAYTARQDLGKGVTLARLNNGMTVIVQENHSAPVATVRCYLHNTGSAFEGRDLGAGLSHVLEHLVAGGSTTRRTEPQIREILDSLGGRNNAYTSESVTCFLIDCPGSGVSVAIELIADNMRNSVIPENEYKREMGVVQRELEMGEANRDQVLHQMMKELIYTEHPARHPVIGYLPVVQQIKREEVIAFYKNRYVPQNMTLVVVGDVKTSETLDTALAMFKGFQRTTERYDVLPEEPLQASPRSARREMEGPTTEFAIAWPTVPLQDPDLYPLDVASFILTNGDSSRLTKRLTIDEPLAISVSSFSNTPGYARGWFQINTESEPAALPKIRKILFEEIERLKTEPVSAKELAKAKRQKAAEHVFHQDKVENQAEMLSESYRSTGDPLFDSHYVEGIAKVTPEQIVAVAKKYFVPERLNTVLIEPIGSSAGKATDRATAAAESPISKRVLPNGLTVLLKRQANLPMVTIQAYVRAGVVAETPETSGLASLTTDMLQHGTAKYDVAAIAEYFDSIGGVLKLDSQTNTSYLQTQILSEDAPKTLDYVRQLLFEPTFPKEEFDNVRELQLAAIAAQQAEPTAELFDFFVKQLPKSTPYSRRPIGDPAALRKLTPADCRKFHKAFFVPNNMVLSVFGDIEPDAMSKQVEAVFGNVPKAETFKWPAWPDDLPALKADGTAHLQNKKENTAMLLLSFPSVGVRDQATQSALDVLEGVLTGSGGTGRLFEELRGQQLVYYVIGRPMSGFAPGYFNFIAQTRPETLAEVVTRIRANLEKIAKEGIPADEFSKVKAKLVIGHELKNVTPAERAFQASIDELYGLGYDHDKSYADRIGKVKVSDVVDLVKKRFEYSLTVTTSPEKAPDLKPRTK